MTPLTNVKMYCIHGSHLLYRYKKFLKSKDLSVQSSEDLDCVLARKRRKVSTETGNTVSYYKYM